MCAAELHLHFSTTIQLFLYIFHFLEKAGYSESFIGSKRETKQEARKRDVLCQDISKSQFSFLLVSRVFMLNAGSKGNVCMNVCYMNVMNVNECKCYHVDKCYKLSYFSVNYDFLCKLCKSRFPHAGLNMHHWIQTNFLRNVHSGNSEENN